MDPSDAAPAPSALPIGRTGRLEALALTTAGDHALLVRETGTDQRGRALLTTDKLATGERLVVMPLDDDVDVRVDGDALAVWLGSGSLLGGPVSSQSPASVPDVATGVPVWATLIGGGLLLLTLAFAVIGSAVVFAWLLRAFS
ncbi:MAG TPA: hypothetical protein VMM85_05460 [Methylomirabilota bacterium]|nr:hypothetical protein [Methylomirabilota bacterium]